MDTKTDRVVTYNKELLSIKTCPFYDVVELVIWISLIRSAGLEHKCLSRHRLLVINLSKEVLYVNE